MRMKEIKRVAVLGAGTMGHGIAQCFAQGGCDVSLNDLNQEILKKSLERIESNLKTFAAAGLVERKTIPGVLGRISTTPNLEEAVKEADFIQETVKEDLKVKQEVFRRVEAACPRGAIIATNTSGLRLTDINQGVKRKERTIIAHWVNPPHIIPAVEVAKGEGTSEATLLATYDFLLKLKKWPVRISKEVPGLVINRLQAAFFREVLALLDSGVVEPAQLDRAVKGGIGFRLAFLGPVEVADFGGLDIWYKVMCDLYPVIDRSLEPPAILKKKVEAGDLGVKSGKGFYEYTPETVLVKTEERDRQFLQRLKDLLS